MTDGAAGAQPAASTATDPNLPAPRQVPAPETRSRWPASPRRMSFGVQLPMAEQHTFGGTPRFRDLVDLARAAEAAGFEFCWFADHFYFPPLPGGDERGCWEAWTTMAGIAARTERIHFGPLVACTGFRNPGLTAKMAESLDEIGQGRFVLGLGAGWYEPEYRAFGYPFDHRASRFEEAIQIIRALLRTGAADYQGYYEEVHHARNRPQGPRPGGIPIMIGTSGRRMLRLTARFADAWNTVWHRDPAEAAANLELLKQACADVGRDPSTITWTAGGNVAMPGYLGRRPDPIAGSPEAIAETIARFRDLGFAHFVAGLDPCTTESITQFGRVIEILDRTG